MLIEGKFNVKAPIQKAWDNILSTETLASCIPGCKKIELIDKNTFETVVAAKVGSISVRFKFTTTLIEIKPPLYLKAIGKGAELNKAGTFNQESVISFKKVSDKETEVSYRSEIRIVGKLAAFGDRIMKAKAIVIGEQFSQALNNRLIGEIAVTPQLAVSTPDMLSVSLTGLKEQVTKIFRK